MASKSMTKTEIISSLADQNDVTRKQMAKILSDLVELSYKEAKNGFSIPGLGKLVLSDRAARKGRNPATGEEIDIPAKTVLKFRIAKSAKDACLS